MKYKPFTFRFVRYLWLYKLTPGARHLLYGLALACVGSVLVVVPIYQIMCALLALLGLSWVAGFIFRPNVTLSGHLPIKATAGQSVSGTFTLTNQARRPAYDLTLNLFGLPDALIQLDQDDSIRSLSRGGSDSLPVSVQTLRRGFYVLPDLTAHSTFPFNLLRSGASHFPMGSLLVLPAFHRLAEIDVPYSNRYQPGGIALTSNIGESPEYIGNREYVPGEPARRLDFRSWARLGKPIVREYQEEYYCRIALILDTFVPPRRKADRKGFAELEASVSLAASIADALSFGEYILDIFAAGPELYRFRSGRHTAHFEQVLEILACIDACREDPFDTLIPAVAEELENISTAICIFLDWDASRMELAHVVLQAGCSLKAVIVRDGKLSEEVDVEEFGDVRQYPVAQIRDEGLERL